MPEFQVPADIGNRALQHCGADLMDSTLGFTEQSNRARAVSFCYGKLRRSELRENVWTFATRRTALRAVDTNTLLMAPALWSSLTTYFAGSIVTDQNGTAWQSTVVNNLNNTPGNSNTWVPYFGPMTAALYDSSQSYFSGEVVYTAAGDGTYNVYASLVSGNNIHPALPNQWAAGTTYFKNQVVQAFPAWAVGTTYAAGASVVYTDGLIYSSLTAGNVGHIPPSSLSSWAPMPTLTLTSQLVPAGTPSAPPSTTPIAEWQQASTYVLGSFVMFNSSVYVSLQASNTGHFPNAAASTFWAKATGGTSYMGLTILNIGNNPATAPALWSAATTYALAALVAGSDGNVYSSLANGNINHDPTTDIVNWVATGALAPWTTSFTLGGGNSMWLQIGGATFPFGVGLTGLNILYPINCGPCSQVGTQNVYRLPAGYVRSAPQNPKADTVSYLGAPGNAPALDWEFEGGYIITSEINPIVFRFVADVQDVTTFDDMFCEGLACRIGLEVAEPLTQSTSKVGVIGKFYSEMMGKAKRQNAIEEGADELPLDDYLACRA